MLLKSNTNNCSDIFNLIHPRLPWRPTSGMLLHPSPWSNASACLECLECYQLEMTSFQDFGSGTCLLWLYLPYFLIHSHGCAFLWWDLLPSTDFLLFIPSPSLNFMILLESHNAPLQCFLFLPCPLQLGSCHINDTWPLYPYLPFLRLTARFWSTRLPQSHMKFSRTFVTIHHPFCQSHFNSWNSLELAVLTHSFSFLFDWRTAFPMELNWSIRREFQSSNLLSLAFQALSELVSARTQSPWHLHRSLFCCHLLFQRMTSLHFQSSYL